MKCYFQMTFPVILVISCGSKIGWTSLSIPSFPSFAPESNWIQLESNCSFLQPQLESKYVDLEKLLPPCTHRHSHCTLPSVPICVPIFPILRFSNTQNMIFLLGLLHNNFRWLPYVHQTTHWWNGTWYRYKLKDKTNCVWSWRFAILAGINWIWHKRTIFKFYGRIADNSILGFCLWIRGTRIGVSSHGIFLKKKNIYNILRSNDQ